MSIRPFLDSLGISLDSVNLIPRCTLNPDTWSPMLVDCPGDTIAASYRLLLRYAIEQSDNNASNYLFKNVLNPASVEASISAILPQANFHIKYSEEQMQADHRRAYCNYTSPLSAAELINWLYTQLIPADSLASDPLLIGSELQFVSASLENCKTGQDRIMAPLKDIDGITIGHKTGSGFRDDGLLIAQNDVAFVGLPDGRHYSLAVFIKDTPESEADASKTISLISAICYRNISGTPI